MKAYYFGCWQRSGHYFFLPGMRSEPREWGHWWAPTPWREKVDGHLTPGERDRHGRLEALGRGSQGEAALHHREGWTALAIHDFTVDSRGGSNSVFFFDEEMDFARTLYWAKVSFPHVMDRIGEVRLVEGPGICGARSRPAKNVADASDVRIYTCGLLVGHGGQHQETEGEDPMRWGDELRDLRTR